jgi:hypothetical protein
MRCDLPTKKTVKCAYKQCTTIIPMQYGEPGVSLSRWDNRSLVCSDCGTQEAFGRRLQSELAKDGAHL